MYTYKPQAQRQVPQQQPIKVQQQQPQQYKYIVVLDFEATCDENVKIDRQEIIEFPSVLIDVERGVIIDEFREYVRPVHNPILTKFCKELTGIQQEWVDAADLFENVVERHRQWMIKNGLLLESGEKSYENTFLFLTCGDWDLNIMLPYQYKNWAGHSGKWPSYFYNWNNVKKTYSSFYNKHAGGMVSMLSHLNIQLVGRHHSGLDDCKNIASIALRLLRDGAVFSITGTRTPKEPKPVYNKGRQ